MRFGIYDIDLVDGAITPSIFEWNGMPKEWEPYKTLSHRTRAVLPRPPASPTSRSPVSIIARHVVLDQEMFNELVAHFGYEKFLQAVGENHGALKERQFKAKPRNLLAGLRDIPGVPEAVRRAIERALGGDLKGAIEDMKKLVSKDSQQRPVFLRLLAASPEPKHWADAEPLLQEVGRPSDLLAFSFGYWTERNFDKAIKLTKWGLKLSTESSAPEGRR